MAEYGSRLAFARSYPVVEELANERQWKIDTIRVIFSSDDLEFITSGKCADEIVKDIKCDKLALLLGRYEYHAYDSESPERALVKAILLKESFEKKGLRVEIFDPQPTDSVSPLRRSSHFRTIVISGWKTSNSVNRFLNQQVPLEESRL